MSESNNEGKSKVVVILGAITAMIVALTALVTVMGENDLFDWVTENATATEANAAPTEDSGGGLAEIFPTPTAVNEAAELPTPKPATAVPEPVVVDPPTCANYAAYTGKAKKNAILVGYTQSEFWVGVNDLPEAAQAHGDLTGYIFDNSEASQTCLRSWVKYLTTDHTAHWPDAGGKGNTDAVWLSAGTPAVVGALANWAAAPDMLLVAVVGPDMEPDFVQVYACGKNVDMADRALTAFWHAATTEAALQEYVSLYENNGYEVRGLQPCE